jgi:hypothetical protein
MGAGYTYLFRVTPDRLKSIWNKSVIMWQTNYLFDLLPDGLLSFLNIIYRIGCKCSPYVLEASGALNYTVLQDSASLSLPLD